MVTMPATSAIAISAEADTDSGAVPPADDSGQACTGAPWRPACTIASVSMQLNSSGENEQVMPPVDGFAPGASSPPAATAAIFNGSSTFSF